MSIVSHHRVNLPSAGQLQAYVSSVACRLDHDCLTATNSVEDVDIVDNIEMVIDAEEKDGMYNYDVKLIKYGGVIFEEIFPAALPWDFLGINEALSDSNNKHIQEIMSKSVHPFRLRLKNGNLSFSDKIGQGVFSLGSEPQEEIWCRDIKQQLKTEITSCFFDLSSRKERDSNDIQSRLSKLFINQLMMLEKISHRLNKIASSGDSQIVNEDVEYLMNMLEKLNKIYETIVEPVMPVLEKRFNHLPSSEESSSARKCLIQFRVFYAETSKIVESQGGNQASELVKKFLECNELIGIASAIPELISVLFSSPEVVESIKEKNNAVTREIFTHFEDVKDVEVAYLDHGLIWRCSSVFLSLLRDELSWKIIEYAYGKYSCVELGRKTDFKIRRNMFFGGHIDNCQVAIYERSIHWKTPDGKTHEEKLPGTIFSPQDIMIEGNRLVILVEVIKGFEQIKAVLTADLSLLHKPSSFEIFRSEFKLYGVVKATLHKDHVYVLGEDEEGKSIVLSTVGIDKIGSPVLLNQKGLTEVFDQWNQARVGKECEEKASVNIKNISHLTFGVVKGHILFQYLFRNEDRQVEQVIWVYNLGQIGAEYWSIRSSNKHEGYHLSADLSKSARSTIFFATPKSTMVLLVSPRISFHLTSINGGEVKVAATWDESHNLLSKYLKESDHLAACVKGRTLQLAAIEAPTRPGQHSLILEILSINLPVDHTRRVNPVKKSSRKPQNPL